MNESEDTQDITGFEELGIFNHVHNSLIIGLFKFLKDKQIISGDEIIQFINEQKQNTEAIFDERVEDAEYLKRATMRLFDKFRNEIQNI